MKEGAPDRPYFMKVTLRVERSPTTLSLMLPQSAASDEVTGWAAFRRKTAGAEAQPTVTFESRGA